MDGRWRGVVEIADGVRAGKLHAAEVLQEALKAVEEGNQRLNALVHVGDPAELERHAAKIDEEVSRGQDPGLLAGVPLAAKDLEDVACMPTTSGSLVTGDHMAADDSPHVARLRRAGALVIGKTNTPEYGYSIDTKNRRFGQTYNPRDVERTPGGSSGGSAAAVAAGLVPLATGSDGGGSIRIPASFCGLPGLKPTFGWIPAKKESWGEFSHWGGLTRTLEDLARYLDVVFDWTRGEEYVQPTSTPFERALRDPLPIAGLRVAASVDLHGAYVEAPVQEAFHEALDRLRAAGARIDVLETPLPESVLAFLDSASYNDGLRWQKWSERERRQLGRGFAAWCQRGTRVSPADLAAGRRRRAELKDRVQELLGSHDVIATPTVGVLPWKVGDSPPVDAGQILFTHPFNLTGNPALTVPMPGVLAGIQFIGPHLGDVFLLRLGKAVMTVYGAASLPPASTGLYERPT